MKNINETIKILFRVISPEKVLSYYFNPFFKDYDFEKTLSNFDLSSFFSAILPKQYSLNEFELIVKLLSSEWCMVSNQKKNVTVFNILCYYTVALEVLEETMGEPIVNYNKLTEWRAVSHEIGEDILSTAFLAYKDSKKGKSAGERCFFDWRPVLKNNNHRLNELLSRGLAENHYHLFGSAPHTAISWMALMNKPMAFKKSFKELYNRKHRMSERISVSLDGETSCFELLVRKAAVIRLALYEVVYYKKTRIEVDKAYSHMLQSTSLKEMDMWMLELQETLNKYSYGRLNGFSTSDQNFDYAINGFASSKEDGAYKGNIAFSGERELLYRFFLGLFSGEQRFMDTVHLFYAYNLIKIQFRGELIQVNNRVGFKNFQEYQNLKFNFILNGSVYERLAISMATTATLANQNIDLLEARFTPATPKNLYKRIKGIDNIVRDRRFYKDNIFEKNNNFSEYGIVNEENEAYLKKLFYAIHFIKSEEKNSRKKYWTDLKPRNASVREQVKKNAMYLKSFKDSGNSLSNRILGIDAASSEIGCRPEVFAQAFRLLRSFESEQGNQFLKHEKYIKPGITFHVGEDFFDLTDGLRAIDEAIKFLRLNQGDRMGHALALGVDPKAYYESKGHVLVMPSQDLLDNAVWMYHQMRKYNIHDTQVEKMLNKVFINLFKKIYGASFSEAPCIHMYYDSWKLRGDNPEKIAELKTLIDDEEWNTCDKLIERTLTLWDYYAYGLRDAFDQRIYNDKSTLELYWCYHFDKRAKEKGQEITEFKVIPGYIDVVKQIQKCMQLLIQEKNIAIETNPTSNVLIGPFKDYDSHPIFSWYNIGLTYSEKELKECPQLYVSVNTDDQGVFNTYLENEYALLAQALERKKDEQGNALYKESMIYDWLEQLRKMGIQQSFASKLK